MSEHDRLLDRFDAIAPQFAEARREAQLEYPGLDYLVVGAYGRLVAEHAVDERAIVAALQLAEEVLAGSHTEAAKELMSTGFLDAITNRWPEERLPWLAARMGPECRAYCKSWDESCGRDGSVWNGRR